MSDRFARAFARAFACACSALWGSSIFLWTESVRGQKDSASLQHVCTCIWGELGDVEVWGCKRGRGGGTHTATSERPFPSLFTQTTKVQSI